jgi:DNA-directed RNA polymerase subunit RPC12/RpoP
MKQGDNFDCPHCGNSAFLKKESVMDGWNKVGEILSCASCSTKIADIEEEKKTEKSSADSSVDALANLLGAEKEAKLTIEASEDEKHFCRDCAHFISHPFLDRCALHDTDVNPMEDCAEFEPKKKSE